MIKSHFDLYAKFISHQKGYGVFTNEHIPKNSIVETIYCVPINPTREWDEFKFGNDRFKQFMPLGFGVIYNHSDSPNILWREVGERLIEFYSVKEIQVGDELCHRYGENYFKRFKKEKLI